jgi:hypothetical protein
MGNVVNDPTNGQGKASAPGAAKKTNTKPAAVKSLEERAKKIAEAIQHHKLLSEKVEHRQIFHEKLEEIQSCQSELRDSEREQWDSSIFKVTLATYTGRTLLSFSQGVLIEDFLAFMGDRITEKMDAIDQEIIELEA